LSEVDNFLAEIHSRLVVELQGLHLASGTATLDQPEPADVTDR
jgi:hypothetical protein